MPQIVKNIPLMDLMSFLMESPDSPIGVGALQIMAPVKGSSAEVVARILDGFRNSHVDEPFNFVPVFPRFGRPKWAVCDYFDADYHVRHLSVPAPGSERQLIDLVMDLHGTLLDRSRPGWIAYVIDGLDHDRLAVYWKVHHAYIDGASLVARMSRSVATEAGDVKVRPIWSPLLDTHPSHTKPPPFWSQLGSQLGQQTQALGEVAAAVGRNMLQAGGLLPGERTLPFSAPATRFNRPVHATRRLGVGATQLARYRSIARHQQVTVNDIALTMVGHALERYAAEYQELPERSLVAICPLAVRSRVARGAATQISAISVSLGAPGSDVLERLHQVHRSAMEAKAEAARLSPQAQMDYLVLMGSVIEAVSKSPLGELLPPSTNVNVSNVVGPPHSCFFAGAEVVRTYPVSTLAGGTAINITFNSYAGHMDFAAITDALAIPDPQRIADFMLAALDDLEQSTGPAASEEKHLSRNPKRSPRQRAGGSVGKPKARRNATAKAAGNKPRAKAGVKAKAKRSGRRKP